MKPQPRYKKDDKIGGRYQVHKALMGGMGEVYLCLDLKVNLPYALKTFQQRYLTDTQRLRRAFEQEVATWVALEKHPNIVRCFHLDILGNQPFMVLEWVAGEEGRGVDLRSWLQRGTLDVKLALEIAVDICCGLLHAQEKRPALVHRDLKPENILIAQGGLAKITDFGLAQMVTTAQLDIGQEGIANSSRQSIVGGKGIAGTPAYMAPEQWRGEPLDERTDIYALGCILYEMLTGASPFTVEILPNLYQNQQAWLSAMQDAHERGKSVSIPTHLPMALIHLIRCCLAKEATARPTSLAELLTELTKIYCEHVGQVLPIRPAPDVFTGADYNNRGNTYRALKQYEPALADYNQVLAFNATDAQVYNNRGATYLEMQDYAKALDDFNRALALMPNDAKVTNNRGVAYLALQQYQAALDDHTRALMLDPNYAEAHYNRGLVYATLHEYEAAIAAYSQAIELNPTYAEPYNNRGVVYRDLKAYHLALADYTRAIALNPSYGQAYANRGMVNETLQQHEAAILDFSCCLEIEPNNATFFYNRGTLYAAAQRYQAALADYNCALALNPIYAAIYNNRGNIYQALQQYAAALRDYDRAIEFEVGYAQAFYNRGNTYRALQQYEAALADQNRAVILDPNDPLAYYNRGVTYITLQQYGAALADFDRAIDLNYSDPNLYALRGDACVALQQHQTALAEYHRAVALDPNFASGYFAIGALLVNRAQRRDALPYLEKATQLGDPRGAQHLARIKEMVALEASMPVNPAQQAFDAFQRARSPAEMQEAVARYALLGQADFLKTIEQNIAQKLSSKEQTAFSQRLAWLRQIVEAQV